MTDLQRARAHGMDPVVAQAQTLQVREMLEVTRMQHFNAVSLYRQILKIPVSTEGVFADSRQLVV